MKSSYFPEKLFDFIDEPKDFNFKGKLKDFREKLQDFKLFQSVEDLSDSAASIIEVAIQVQRWEG